MNDLQSQLKAHLTKTGVVAWHILKRLEENPYPIGTRAVYMLYLGKEISDSHKWKMQVFFSDLEKDKHKANYFK